MVLLLSSPHRRILRMQVRCRDEYTPGVIALNPLIAVQPRRGDRFDCAVEWCLVGALCHSHSPSGR